MRDKILSSYVAVAQITKSHGIKGEVVVVPTNGLPFVLHEGMEVCLVPPQFEYDRFNTVEWADPFQNGFLVKFSNLNSIDESELAAPGTVLVRAKDVPELDDPTTPYALLDRRVVDGERGFIGTIVEVMETPANDVWVLDGSVFGEVLIPVIEQVVPEIPEDGDIPVTLLPGLIDDADSEKGGEE